MKAIALNQRLTALCALRVAAIQHIQQGHRDSEGSRRAQAQQAPATTGRAGALLNCLRPAAATLSPKPEHPPGRAAPAWQLSAGGLPSRRGKPCVAAVLGFRTVCTELEKHTLQVPCATAGSGWQRRASGQAAGDLRGGGMLFRSAPKVRGWRHQMWCAVTSTRAAAQRYGSLR